MFEESLIKYMKMTQCSSNKLSEITNIAQSSISRYLNGNRVPDPGSDIIEYLAEGLASCASDDDRGGYFFRI